MDFETLVRRFRILFSFFGIIPFNPPIKRVRKWIVCADIFPAIFHLVSVTALLSSAIYYQYQFTSKRIATPASIVTSIALYARAFGEFLMQLSIIGQAFVFRERFKKLYRDYDFIQNYMKTRMRYIVDFNVFSKILYHTFAAVFAPHIAASVVRATLSLNIAQYQVYNTFIISNILATMVQFHIIAHVVLLRFFLTQMTRWLCEQVAEFSAISLCERKSLLVVSPSNRYDEVLQLKFLHFKLWKLSMNFSRIFGWSLAAIIMRNLIEMAYGVYWVLFYSFRGAKFDYVLRKCTEVFLRSRTCYFWSTQEI